MTRVCANRNQRRTANACRDLNFGLLRCSADYRYRLRAIDTVVLINKINVKIIQKKKFLATSSRHVLLRLQNPSLQTRS